MSHLFCLDAINVELMKISPVSVEVGQTARHLPVSRDQTLVVEVFQHSSVCHVTANMRISQRIETRHRRLIHIRVVSIEIQTIVGFPDLKFELISCEMRSYVGIYQCVMLHPSIHT